MDKIMKVTPGEGLISISTVESVNSKWISYLALLNKIFAASVTALNLNITQKEGAYLCSNLLAKSSTGGV